MKKIISKLVGMYFNVLAIVAPRYAGRAAFLLFCHPFRGKMTMRHRQFLDTAAQFDLKLDAEVIKAYQWGNGKRKVLMLHGWQSHTYRWKSYIEAFDKSEYTIFSLDAPGHGLSTGKFMSVPYYNRAIELLLQKIGRVDVAVGHSIGAFTGMYSFYLNPKLAPEKFVALAPPGEAQEFFDFYTQQLGLSKYSSKLAIQHFTNAVGNPPSYFSAPVFVNDFKFPGLLIHDELDDDTSVENSKKIHQAWKKSQLIITKGKGHNLKSTEVVNAVAEFVKDVSQKNELAVLKTSH